MQLTAATQGSSPVHGHVLSIAQPVLPISIRKVATDPRFPTDAGPTTAPPAPSRQDPIPVTPTTVPVLPDSQGPGCKTVPTTKNHMIAPPKIVRPRFASVSRRLSKNSPFEEQDIPLYLVPAIIARAIWQKGELTFRISVIRTQQHYYTIRLRTARPGTGKGNRHCEKSKCGNKPGTRKKPDNRSLS